VLDELAAATRVEEAAEEQDVESRVNSVNALYQVMEKLVSTGSGSGGSDSGNGSAVDEAVWLQQAIEGTVTPLLAVLRDYTVDNRGDVGSWVREAGMECLSRLLVLLAPLALRHAAPAALLRDAAAAALHAFLKQAVERIARVREVAGTAIQALLPVAAAAGVAHAAQVAGAVKGRRPEEFANLEALCAVTGLLRWEELRESLLEGLAFSIGGLDGQLSAAAADAAVQAMSELDMEGMEGVGAALMRVWEQQGRVGRLCTPMLMLVDVLLSRTDMRDLRPPASPFPQQLLTTVNSAVVGCTDVPRLHAAAAVLCQLVDMPPPVRQGALAGALSLLGNRYPKVRVAWLFWYASSSCRASLCRQI
jgi:hypothetical protein